MKTPDSITFYSAVRGGRPCTRSLCLTAGTIVGFVAILAQTIGLAEQPTSPASQPAARSPQRELDRSLDSKGRNGTKPEILQIRSPDGHFCNAILQLPDGEGPFPGVVAIHPGMGDRTVEWLLRTDINAAPKYLVRQGYAVLTSDYRHPSHLNLEIDDTIAAYEMLRKHPKVISDKVGLCGASHGAVCAIYAGMRIKPACIVAEEGATDIAYRYTLLHESIRAQRGPIEGFMKLDKELWDELAERLGGSPDVVPEAYERMSGHAQAAKIGSPILIITGDGEYLPHCLTMYAALLRAKKPCEFALYENAPHAFWWCRKNTPALAQADAKVLAFLEKHLRK